MAICTRLKRFLDDHGVKYVTIDHSPAFSAQEVARSAHVQARVVVKPVIVNADGKPAMVAVAASQRVNLRRVREALDARQVELVSENDFAELFRDCDLGAMPPFGNLYGMPVIIDPLLCRDQEIVFNGGDHLTVVRMAFEDYDRLVRPVKAEVTGDREDDHYWQH